MTVTGYAALAEGARRFEADAAGAAEDEHVGRCGRYHGKGRQQDRDSCSSGVKHFPDILTL